MQRLNHMRLGHIEWTEENAESMYACTGCRHCTTYCEHGNEPGIVLFSGRAEANRRGVQHKNLKDYPDRFRRRDHRLVENLRRDFSEELSSSKERLPSVAYFPGCDATDKSVDDVKKTLALLSIISETPVALADTNVGCAGYPLIAAGYTDMFRWQANRLAEDVRGYSRIIVNCSACVHATKDFYPKEGVHLSCDVVSLPEYIDECIEKLQPKDKKPEVYYHDPCYLARYQNVVDQPRRVLSQIAVVREFSWSGGEADCCGGAGLLPKTMPATADKMAADRLREIAQAGGGTVVSGCGTCTFMLRQNAPEGVNVRGFGAFIEECLAAK